MKNRTQQIIDRAQRAGSTAATFRGAVKFCVKNKLVCDEKKTVTLAKINLDDVPVGSKIILEKNLKYGFKFRRLQNAEAQREASETIGKCGKKTNFSKGEARVYGEAWQSRFETINYKGKYKGYTGSHLYQDYQSCLAVSRSGRSVLIIISCVVRRRLIAPAGMLFKTDENGVLLRRTLDGMDFHPSDWFSKTFATDCRKALAANFKARLAAKKTAKTQEHFANIFNREIKSTRVLLEDSRRAGNCVEGTLKFAEIRFGISRDEILAAPFLIGVSAEKLIKTLEPLAVSAARCAFERETTISI